MRCVTGFLLLLTMPLCARPALAWAMKTHVWIADQILIDLEDGSLEFREAVVTAEGSRAPSDAALCEIAPPDEVRAAILAFPSEFRSGCCGPDAYPDIYYGQSIIHPFYPGKPWKAIDYARHLLECARDESGETRQRALAWAYGFLCHEAGDAFGHTWVNSHTGGAWDWGNVDLVTSHVALEDFVNSRLPAPDMDGGELAIEVDTDFVAEALIRHDDVSSSLVHAGHLQALEDYRRFFDRGVDKISELMDKTWGLDISGGALSAMRAALRSQRDVADEATEQWIATSNRIAREVLGGNVLLIPGHVSEWVGTWIPQLLGIPECVLTAIEYLGWPMSVITDWISEKFLELLQAFYEATLADTLAPYLDPETWYRQTQPAEEQVVIEREMGLEAGSDTLDPTRFPALWDSVQLGRLVLLDGPGIAQLGQALAVEIPWGGGSDNILFNCIESLDASHQLSRYPSFRLLETPELAELAYGRLFLTPAWTPPAGRIDPAHLWVYSSGEGRLEFVVPILDAGQEGGRLVSSVYQEAESGSERVPWNEQGVPTTGTAGVCAAVLTVSYEPDEGREGAYHLATASPIEGTNELSEDLGVDIRIDRGMPWMQPESGPSELPAEMAAMVPGGHIPTEEEQAAQFAALLDSMRETADMFEQAGQAEMADQLRARIAELEASRTEEAPEDVPLEPWAFEAEMTVWLRESLEAGTIGEVDPLPGDEDIPEALRDARWAIGAVTDDAGVPVPEACVTLVEASAFQALRAAASVPVLELEELIFEGRYHFGNCNEAGDFLLPWTPPGDYVLIASAPGWAKSERTLRVEPTETAGLLLPTVTLGREPGETDTASASATADTGEGEDIPVPGLVAEVVDPDLGWDRADAEGVAATEVRLWPTGGFTGPVELSLEGAPEGVQAEFIPATPLVERPTSVRLRIWAEGEAAFGGATLIARGEGIEARRPILVSLALGRLACEPSPIEVRAGEAADFRIWCEGLGQAPTVTAEALPEGLTLRTIRIKQNRDVEPFEAEGLTLERAQEAAEALRPLVPRIADEAPVPLAISEHELRDAPRAALTRGLLVAPGGWVDVRLEASRDAEPGVYGIVFLLRYGEHATVRQEVEAVVMP